MLINKYVFKELFTELSNFTGSNKSREILTGIHITYHAGEESLIAEATDSHVFYRVPIPIIGCSDKDIDMVIKPLDFRGLDKTAKNILIDFEKMEYTDGKTAWKLNRITEEEYPNTDHVIPNTENYDKFLCLKAGNLQKILKNMDKEEVLTFSFNREIDIVNISRRYSNSEKAGIMLISPCRRVK